MSCTTGFSSSCSLAGNIQPVMINVVRVIQALQQGKELLKEHPDNLSDHRCFQTHSCDNVCLVSIKSCWVE